MLKLAQELDTSVEELFLIRRNDVWQIQII